MTTTASQPAPRSTNNSRTSQQVATGCGAVGQPTRLTSMWHVSILTM